MTRKLFIILLTIGVLLNSTTAWAGNWGSLTLGQDAWGEDNLTIGDGTGPGDTALPPGGSATMLDAFTLQTSGGIDTVTSITVSLSAGVAAGLNFVEITDDAGLTVYGNTLNPVSDTVVITLGTNITATTVSTQYKVRITPKSHADLPELPGDTYVITGLVTAISSTNTTTYSDTSSATVTIDNFSPTNASWGTVTPGDMQITLNWTNPGDADFSQVVILRDTFPISDTPVEGATYAQDDAIASSKVAYVGNLQSFIDTGLTNGVDYYYRIFTKDASGNYSMSGIGTGAHIPVAPDPTPPTTTASPTGGSYMTAQSVTLSCDDGVGSGCGNIYFTTDGSPPTTGSSVYSNPINISNATNLKFFAEDLAGNQESVKTEIYTIDRCPGDPLKIDPGICGCGVPDDDSDGDGTIDCFDLCPIDPTKIDPGICGCGVADTDTDGDATPNCNDGCLNDPLKTDPGICGCGTADDDTEGDTIPNCIDNCLNDPNTDQADTDTDGIGDVCDPGFTVPPNPGDNSTIAPAPEISITLPDVTVGGDVTVEDLPNPGQPASFRLIGGTAFDINFSGVFNGIAAICIEYDEAEVRGNESNIKLFHRVEPNWEDITTTVDTDLNTVCGETATFSPFILAEPCPSDTDGDGICDETDLCPGSDDNLNADGDVMPDDCDAFPNDPNEWADTDGDGIGDNSDPFDDNATEWKDTDFDLIGDNLDNCVLVNNPNQEDDDNDTIGNACDSNPLPNYGSVLDAPHNQARGITCNTCHTYSIWWQYSPTVNGETLYETITNGICNNCHSINGNGNGQQINAVHSSTAMGTMHNGDLGYWKVKCVDCHYPHRQEQLDWIDENRSDLFLVDGSIDGNFRIEGGLTKFDYTSDNVTFGWNWDDREGWGRKNDFLPPSGLILVEGADNATNTYEIISANATTITVKGGLNPASEGGSFAIIYGQLIKSEIITPVPENRDVKFFDPLNPAGGFTDNDVPVKGICQVCHKYTSVWSYNGTLTDDPSHTGIGRTDCTGCHIPTQGFKPDLSIDCTNAGGYWWSDNTCLGVPENETVESAGQVWMDRNLGASQVATSDNDTLAYGDLYQWGRGTDGHQYRDSNTTSTTSSTDDPGHDDFIVPFPDSNDWRVPQNDNLWQGASGINNPCPAGFRLPTETEWGSEIASWSGSNLAGAFASPLKLPGSGLRHFTSGSVLSEGIAGHYWSGTASSIATDQSTSLFYNIDNGGMGFGVRAAGYSVRCIKD